MTKADHGEGAERHRTWKDVWHVKLLDVCDRVLPEGCTILPIWIALMWPPAIPVRLLVLCWNTQMDPYPRN